MTDATATPLIDDARARRNVVVLVLAQAILGAQMPMIFVIGGLAGGMLASNPCLATLPISLIVFGSMTTAPWLSPLMQRRGRRFGFFIGAIAGAIGAMINFAVAFGVSSVTKETPQEIKDLVESVRTPKGAGAALDH